MSHSKDLPIIVVVTTLLAAPWPYAFIDRGEDRHVNHQPHTSHEMYYYNHISGAGFEQSGTVSDTVRAFPLNISFNLDES